MSMMIRREITRSEMYLDELLQEVPKAKHQAIFQQKNARVEPAM